MPAPNVCLLEKDHKAALRTTLVLYFNVRSGGGFFGFVNTA